MGLGRLTRRLAAGLFACGIAVGCATSDARRPGSLTPRASDEERRDRALLSRLTELLGGPLPAPASEDEVGVEEPSFEVTRVFAREAPPLAGQPTQLRATAFRGEVSSLELTFPRGCDRACAASLARSLEGWVGPLQGHQEGRAHFLSAEADTTRVRLEVFPARPDLTRLLIACIPLENTAQGRPSRMPAPFGPRTPAPPPRCRAVPP